MDDQQREARAAKSRAEWTALNRALARAVTYRVLFMTGYSYMMDKLIDAQAGVITPGQLYQFSAMLREAMAKHSKRVKDITAVASPAQAAPRWSELER